jgi:hypothetical protein
MTLGLLQVWSVLKEPRGEELLSSENFGTLIRSAYLCEVELLSLCTGPLIQFFPGHLPIHPTPILDAEFKHCHFVIGVLGLLRVSSRCLSIKSRSMYKVLTGGHCLGSLSAAAAVPRTPLPWWWCCCCDRLV